MFPVLVAGALAVSVACIPSAGASSRVTPCDLSPVPRQRSFLGGARSGGDPVTSPAACRWSLIQANDFSS